MSLYYMNPVARPEQPEGPSRDEKVFWLFMEGLGVTLKIDSNTRRNGVIMENTKRHGVILGMNPKPERLEVLSPLKYRTNSVERTSGRQSPVTEKYAHVGPDSDENAHLLKVLRNKNAYLKEEIKKYTKVPDFIGKSMTDHDINELIKDGHLLGEGRDGKVYKIDNWPGQNGTVAVKLAKLVCMGKREWVKETVFTKELGERSEFIISLLEAHITESWGVMVLPFYDVPLMDHLIGLTTDNANMKLLIKDVQDFAYSMTSAVHAMQRDNTIHNDLRWFNVLVDGNGKYAVADMGNTYRFNEEFAVAEKRRERLDIAKLIMDFVLRSGLLKKRIKWTAIESTGKASREAKTPALDLSEFVADSDCRDLTDFLEQIYNGATTEQLLSHDFLKEYVSRYL